jgi:hypothetical protein
MAEPDDGRTDVAVTPEAEIMHRERKNIAAALKLSGGRIYGPGGRR